MNKKQFKYSRNYKLQKRKSSDFNFRKYKIIFGWVLFLSIILAYILFFSPIFEIKQISVSGNKSITEEEIKDFLNNFLNQKLLAFFNKNNLFLITSEKFENILIDGFPKISFVKIEKDLAKKTINLEITERNSVGIFCRQEKCYYIDQNGIVFEKAPTTKGTLILVIKDRSNVPIDFGQKVISKQALSDLVKTRSDLLKQFSIGILNFEIKSSVLKELRAYTSQGWYIVFDWSRNLGEQLEDLKLVLEKKIKENSQNLEYIDLRIKRRAYYRLK